MPRKSKSKPPPLKAEVVHAEPSVQSVFERLHEMKWGITAEQRTALIKEMVRVALHGESTPRDKVGAMMAVLAAQDIDMKAAKLMLDKALIEHLAGNAAKNDNLIPVSTLNLKLEDKVKLLAEHRANKQLRIMSG
jgi:hypothetical protein